MRARPAKRSETTSARKWSPPPVRSSTSACAPGRASSMRCLSSCALGIQPMRVAGRRGYNRGRMVTLTDIAAEKVRQFMNGQQADSEVGLRVGVRGGGCSGFQYALALDERRDEDQVFDSQGIRVLV